MNALPAWVTDPEVAEKVKLGLARFLETGNMALAAREAGISTAVLERAFDRTVGDPSKHRDKILERREQRLLDASLDVVTQAQEILREKLPDLPARDVIQAGRAAGSLASTLAGWRDSTGAASGPGLSAFAQALAQHGGGKATVTVKVEKYCEKSRLF